MLVDLFGQVTVAIKMMTRRSARASVALATW